MSERKKNILLLIASLLFGAVSAEIILRLFVEQETKRLAVYDSELGWTGKPDGEGIYVRKKDDIRTPFRYNELGFRDEPVTQKGPETTRILFLGDSFLESLEVEYEKTFHELFEEKLRAEGKFDVVNVSSQGYSTAQELIALRKYKDRIRPDVVLLVVYTGNDFADNLRSDFAYLDDGGSVRFVQKEASFLTDLDYSFRRWIYEHSHLVFFLKNTYESVTSQRIAASGKAARSATREQMDILMDRLIAETRNETEAMGARFGVVLISSREEIRKGDFSRADVVVQSCSSLMVPVLDLRPDLSVGHFFRYDEHFNSEGHAITADRLYVFFMEKFGDHQET